MSTDCSTQQTISPDVSAHLLTRPIPRNLPDVVAFLNKSLDMKMKRMTTCLALVLVDKPCVVDHATSGVACTRLEVWHEQEGEAGEPQH
jgi:hypothetical protein